MLISYFKGQPSQHVIAYRNGEIKRNGLGLSLWYAPHRTSIAAIPAVSQDVPFVFNETTANFQEITIQGLLTYRLEKPLEITRYLDFTIDRKTGDFRTDDFEKPAQRLIAAVQTHTRGRINELSLEEALVRVKALSDLALERVNAEPDLIDLGIVLERLHFNNVAATPEMHKALEADYREGLQRRADQAIYARRAAAVEEERKIKQSELSTDIELEERRKELVEMQAENSLRLAEADAKADELKLSPYGDLPAQALVGLALKEWAANAGTIGNLSITPDHLNQLIGWVSGTQK
ncbi:MAG: SPFH domain-containing protein [Gammaproteobacteria bacterium]|nr:SPFH domain-containing protein [Gammaproteobacteria bacterium]